MLLDQVLSQLKAIVGPQHVLLESEDLQRFGVDRTTLWQANPCAVVLPSAVTMVQKIIRLANDCNLAVVPSGGRTGLSGGAVASDGELIWDGQCTFVRMVTCATASAERTRRNTEVE